MITLLNFVFAAVCGAIGAFVLSKTWAWFVVPVFSLPPLDVVQAYGILIVLGVLGVGRTAAKGLKDRNKRASDLTKESVLHSLCCIALYALVLGWAFLFHAVTR